MTPTMDTGIQDTSVLEQCSHIVGQLRAELEPHLRSEERDQPVTDATDQIVLFEEILPRGRPRPADELSAAGADLVR